MLQHNSNLYHRSSLNKINRIKYNGISKIIKLELTDVYKELAHTRNELFKHRIISCFLSGDVSFAFFHR